MIYLNAVVHMTWNISKMCYHDDLIMHVYTVFCIFCRTIFDEKKLLEFAKLGCYLEYDLFGTELLHYHFHPDLDMPSDNERISRYLVQCNEV